MDYLDISFDGKYAQRQFGVYIIEITKKASNIKHFYIGVTGDKNPNQGPRSAIVRLGRHFVCRKGKGDTDNRIARHFNCEENKFSEYHFRYVYFPIDKYGTKIDLTKRVFAIESKLNQEFNRRKLNVISSSDNKILDLNETDNNLLKEILKKLEL